MATPKDLLRLRQKVLSDRRASPLDRACPYVPRPTDIVICGARRTGTTWLQQIMHQIRTKGEDPPPPVEDCYRSEEEDGDTAVEEPESDIDRSVWYIPPYYERMDFDLNGEQPSPDGSPRLYKTHECFEDAPQSIDGRLRYVVVVRDPVDVVWSEKASRYRQLGFDRDVEDLEDMIRPFGPSSMPDGSGTVTYWEHLLSWWPHRHEPNVLWLHYEDLAADTNSCIRLLSEFMGIPLTDCELKTVHRKCTFGYMQSKIGTSFSGRFLTEIASSTLGVKLRAPLAAGVRSDGGTVGQGVWRLDERTKRVVGRFWDHYCRPMTGHRSYESMYKESSILAKRGHARQG